MNSLQAVSKQFRIDVSTALFCVRINYSGCCFIFLILLTEDGDEQQDPKSGHGQIVGNPVRHGSLDFQRRRHRNPPSHGSTEYFCFALASRVVLWRGTQERIDQCVTQSLAQLTLYAPCTSGGSDPLRLVTGALVDAACPSTGDSLAFAGPQMFAFSLSHLTFIFKIFGCFRAVYLNLRSSQFAYCLR